MPDAPNQHARSADGLDELLVRVAGGSQEAFEALYHQTSRRLFGICLRLLPDRAEAEDVLQEVYTTIWRKAEQFDAARAGAMTWLGMIARNKAIDRLRTLSQSPRQAPVEMAEEVADPGEAASPVHHAEAATDRERLEACMQRLDRRRRQLIRIAFFDGATYEELARRVGSPLGSVKSWIRRGLMQLKACLEQ